MSNIVFYAREMLYICYIYVIKVLYNIPITFHVHPYNYLTSSRSSRKQHHLTHQLRSTTVHYTRTMLAQSALLYQPKQQQQQEDVIKNLRAICGSYPYTPSPTMVSCITSAKLSNIFPPKLALQANSGAATWLKT